MNCQLAPYQLHWLEDPVWPPENYAALVAVRAAGNNRIAAAVPSRRCEIAGKAERAS